MIKSGLIGFHLIIKFWWQGGVGHVTTKIIIGSKPIESGGHHKRDGQNEGGKEINKAAIGNHQPNPIATYGQQGRVGTRFIVPTLPCENNGRA